MRVLVLGSLKEMGPWEGFAFLLGEALRQGPLSVSFHSSSGLGRIVAEGYVSSGGAREKVRVYSERIEDVPSSWVSSARVPSSGEGVLPLERREVDVVLILGNGPHLKELLHEFQKAGVPVLPLPIPNTTSEVLWEEGLRSPPGSALSPDFHRFFAGLRRIDPRLKSSSESLARALETLARPPLVGSSGKALFVGGEPNTPEGEDPPEEVVERALRRIPPPLGGPLELEVAGKTWRSAPGDSFLDRVRTSPFVAIDLSHDAASGWLALGAARGALVPCVAFARRGSKLSLPPSPLRVHIFEDDRDLAHLLERRVRGALLPSRSRRRRPPTEKINPPPPSFSPDDEPSRTPQNP